MQLEMWDMHRVAAQWTPSIVDDTPGIADDSDGNTYDNSAEDAYWAELAESVFVVCDKIRRQFTNDELLAILWKRDREVHVELGGYEPTQPTHDGKK